MIDKLAEVVETGVATSEERVPFRDVLADGTQLDGVFSYQAVKFDDGYLLSSRDVTDVVRAEERTRELAAERRRREAVDALATLTTALASARTIADVSEAACAHGTNAAGADFITWRCARQPAVHGADLRGCHCQGVPGPGRVPGSGRHPVCPPPSSRAIPCSSNSCPTPRPRDRDGRFPDRRRGRFGGVGPRARRRPGRSARWDSAGPINSGSQPTLIAASKPSRTS